MNRVIRYSVVIAVLSIFSSSLIAGPTVVLTRQDGYWSGVGGEFTLYPHKVPGLIDGVGVQTFCVEYNEYISLGVPYSAVVNTKAIDGGVGGGGDPIDPMTAFLYDAFCDGALASYGYDYTPGVGREISAGALQGVIWFLEGERIQTWTDGDNSLQDELYQAALGCGWTDIGDVRVLNLYCCGKLRQDQLVRIVVPDPAGILLGGFGVVVVGLLKRRHVL